MIPACYPSAAPQSGVMQAKQATQVRPLSSNFPTGLQAQFVGAEALNRDVLHQPVNGSRPNARMAAEVSPRPRRVISPRPCYSWRSQYSQPVVSGQTGLSSQMVETGTLNSASARLPSSRYAGAPPLSNPNQPRSFKPPTRARTPELQTRHRDRLRVEVAARALQVQPARSISTERSLSTERVRTARHACPARPRTISPEERARHPALRQQPMSHQPRITARGLPGMDMEPITRTQLCAWLNGGGSALRAGREVCRVPGPCEGTLERTPPTAKERSSDSPAAGSTSRSRSCSPSTVPRVLSGSGSPQDVVDVTPPQQLSDRESFERSGSAGNGSGAGRTLGGLGGIGFHGSGAYHKESQLEVHVDHPASLQNEAPLPPARYNGVLTECDTNSPHSRWPQQWCKEATEGKDGRKRPVPLSEDGFSVNAENICSPMPVDLNDSSCTSISFNLSPIKAPMLSGSAGVSSADSLRGALTYSETISTGFSLPTSSRVTPLASGAPSLLPSRRESPKDKENQANSADVLTRGQVAESPQKQERGRNSKGSSERAVSHNSKVFELISLWEQQTGGCNSASSSRRPSGRSSLPSAAKRAVSSPCWSERAHHNSSRTEGSRHIGQKEAITLKAAQDLLKRINKFHTAGGSPGSSDASLEAHQTHMTDSPQSEDSPTKTTRDEICKKLDKGWKQQHIYMKSLAQFLSDCEGSSNIKSNRSASQEDRLASSTLVPQSSPRSLRTAAPPPSCREPSMLEATLSSLPGLQCLKPDTAEPAEGFDARETSAAKSPTAATQPEEEADGPLPGTAAVPVTTKGTDDTKGEDLQERSRDADGARFSTASTVAGEPAMEPQPLESPRPNQPDVKAAGEPDDEPISVVQDTLPSTEGAVEPSISTEPPNTPSAAESPEGEALKTRRSLKGSAKSEEEPQEGEAEEGDVEDSLEELECAEPIEEWEEFVGVRPGEDGIDRGKTILFHLECNELKKEIKIIVPPEGVGPDRKVSFKFQGMSHEIVVPEGYDVGAEVPVTLTKRPFLERNPKHGHFRGHAPEMFPDRGCIFENLRHSPRTNSDNSKLDVQVFKDRYYWYTLLKGLQGCPLLEYTPEEREEDLAEEVELS